MVGQLRGEFDAAALRDTVTDTVRANKVTQGLCTSGKTRALWAQAFTHTHTGI